MAHDFSKLPFDVSKTGPLIDHYPELYDYPIFSFQEDDIYLRLTILITDENSPFVIKEKEFKTIVTSACSYLDISDKNFIEALLIGRVTNEVRKVFSMQDMYFRMFNRWEYQTWYDMLFQYHENSLVLRTPLDPSDDKYEAKSKTKQEIRNHQIKLQKDLINYENQIFAKGTNVKKVVTEHVAKITNWPERMAKDQPIYKPTYG